MVTGILALSMISNGIYNRETTDLRALQRTTLDSEKPTAHKGLLAQKAIC